MSEPKIDTKELSRLAFLLESQLTELAGQSNAASDVLERFKDLINDAKLGNIASPYKYKFFPQEFWEGGALFDETEVAETVALFGLQLRGLNSKGQEKAKHARSACWRR